MEIQSVKPLHWVGSVYFFQSIPFVVVSVIALIFYQQSGLANETATFAVSLLMLPWMTKPLLAPFLEKAHSKRAVTLTMEWLITCIFLVLSFTNHHPAYLMICTTGFGLLAILSSIHDIAVDGLYLIHLNDKVQQTLAPWRGFFFQLGRLAIKGGLVALSAKIALQLNLNFWMLFFMSIAIISFAASIYHLQHLPKHAKQNKTSVNQRSIASIRQLAQEKTFLSTLLFAFLYNVTDAQMQRIIPLFLLDKSGLGLHLLQVSQLYGLYGSLFLMLGIASSGFFLGRFTSQSALRWFTFLLALSHSGFLILALGYSNHLLIYVAIACNQLAFGLANGAYLAHLLYLANRSVAPLTAYTLLTSIMALSYIIFGAFSGQLEASLGYLNFFWFILIANIGLIYFTILWTKNHVK